jgi:hypothetical protein
MFTTITKSLLEYIVIFVAIVTIVPAVVSGSSSAAVADVRSGATALLKAHDLTNHPVALRQNVELAVIVLSEAHVDAAAAGYGAGAW